MAVNPIRRAALVVANLDRAAADELLERMSAEQAAAIRAEIMALSETDPAEQEGVIREFLHPSEVVELPATGEPLEENIGSESPHRIVSSSGNSLSAELEDLLRLDDEVIAMSLLHERSSLVAGMLASLPGPRAAAVLRMLPDAQQTNVLLLLSRGVIPQPEAVNEVAEAICNRCTEASLRPRPGLRHQDALQAILDAMAPQERLEMLRSLETENPLLARRLAATDAKISDCYC